jgi:hypothetical protein
MCRSIQQNIERKQIIFADHSPYRRALFTFCLYTHHIGAIQTKVYYLDKIAHVRVGSVDRLCL